MPEPHEIIEQTTSQLNHLKTMPPTPARLREIKAMERILADAAKYSALSRRAAPRASKAQASDDSEEEVVEKKPRRKVEIAGRQKKITLRIPRKSEADQVDDTQSEQRERELRMADVQSTLGLLNRGSN